MPNSFQKNDLARSIDSGCIVLAFTTASLLASLLARLGLFKWPEGATHLVHGWPPDYIILLIASLVSWAVVSGWIGLYKLDRLQSSRESYLKLARALALWLGTTAMALFFLKLQTVSRQFSLSFFGVASVLMFLRVVAERHLITRPIQRRELRSAVIVGPAQEAEWLLNILSARPEWFGSVKLADLESVHAAIINGKCNPAGSRLNELAEVFLLSGSVNQTFVEECAVRLVKQGRIVHVVPALIDAELFRCNLGEIGGVPTVTLETSNPHELEKVAKRLIDITVAAVLLLLLFPVMITIGLLVKLTSPGPALFAQERLGKNGRKFKILKFRTMRADAEKILQTNEDLYKVYRENNFKLPEGQDCRITKLGRILRASSLDELPQLINVLRGEMSLVGPRPIVPKEIEKYGEYASLLLSLKPGMTGNWQVNGRSRLVDYSDRVKLDLEYLRDQSASKDLQILVKTVGAVARMDGAY
jgi:exopolysaccharide biosynthesis polyprenyl glycosylphosphotransferase